MEDTTEELIAKGGNTSGGNSAGGTPPAKPGNSSDSDGDSTEMMGQPPEMNCDDEENCEMPEMECGDDETCELPDMSEMEGMMGGPGSMGEFMMEDVSGSSDSILHPVAYLAIGGCSVILGIIVSYACFSKCFHKRPGETFSKLKYFIWFIVVALLIAAGLIALGYFIPVWVS